MAKKKTKVAIVVLAPNPELKSVDDGGSAEVENWPYDGKDNIVPVGKAFRCSIHLAERLKSAGRISNYDVIEAEA